MATVNLDKATNTGAQTPAYPDNAMPYAPSDADVFNKPVNVYVGGDGDCAVLPWNSASPVTFKGMLAGSMVPCRCRAVLATAATGNTTCTNINVVY